MHDGTSTELENVPTSATRRQVLSRSLVAAGAMALAGEHSLSRPETADAAAGVLGIYDVKADYGATGNGTTNDQPAIQQAITDCINAGGGIVFLPPGKYLIASKLDLSAAAGTQPGGNNLVAVEILGSGSGGRSLSTSITTRTTHIINASGGPAIWAATMTSARALTNIHVKDVYISNTADLTDPSGEVPYTVECLGVSEGLILENVAVNGAGHLGGGIRVASFDGNWLVSNCNVHNFPTAHGYEVTDGRAGNDGNLISTSYWPGAWQVESGNGVMQSCFSQANSIGYVFRGQMQGISVIGCEHGGTSDYGFWCDSTALAPASAPFAGNFFSSLHIEGAPTAFYMGPNCAGNVVSGLFMAAGGANSYGVYCEGRNNTFQGLSVNGQPGGNLSVGVYFSSSARFNRADAFTSGSVTTRYQDDSTNKDNVWGLNGGGGTVTQATSKSTQVVLNEPYGQITMNGASLAPGARVVFALIDSAIGPYDTVNVNIAASGGVPSTWSNYRVEVAGIQSGGGAATIALTNISGSTLAEAVKLNFAVTKGSITS